LKQKILFVYNWVPDDMRKNELSECASTETVNLIKQILSWYQLDVIPLNAQNEKQMADFIKENMPLDLAFVIAEGFLDQLSSLYDGTGVLRVREILEFYKIPYTHSGLKSMEICRNKFISYKALESKEIYIPKFYLFLDDGLENITKAEKTVGYPMFIKPNGGGNSIGVDENSIVNNRSELIKKIAQLRNLTGEQPILAETYLSGREYTVGIIGNEVPYILPIIAFPKEFIVRSQQIKKLEYKEREKFEIIPLSNPVGLKIHEIALRTYDAIGARDLIRIDLKQDSNGNIYVIDVNGTPSLASKGSLSYMAEKVGINHTELIGFFLYVTMIRYSLPINDILIDTAVKVIAKLKEDYDNQVA